MRNKPARHAPGAAALALLFLLPWFPAQAAGDVEDGKALAREWCSSCHLVESGGQLSAQDSAPPFPEMAADPAYTEQRLRSWLWAPHPPMPDFDLSRYEIDSLVDYIMSLE